MSLGAASTSQRRSLEAELEIAVKSGELKLQCKNLSEFPRSIGKHFVLADTRIADLSRNKLAEIPLECTYFPSLERLVLYHNVIRGIPDNLGSLQSLQLLDLSRNQLSYLPHAICQLSQLQSLIVNNNKLVSLPEEIGELANLMNLDVSCNEIAHLPVQIGDMANLRCLNLRQNHLQEVPVELTYLQLNTLDLSSNRLINLPVELRFMVTLVELSLEENPLQCPPANMCCRGRVHIFKYLETIAIKEDKKRGILADSEHRRSYRKSSQIGDMKFGGAGADARSKRHTADSGYGSEQTTTGNVRRWSTELHDGGSGAGMTSGNNTGAGGGSGPDHRTEDARRLAHRAISYRPAVNSPPAFTNGNNTSMNSSSSTSNKKPPLTIQVSHPSLTSNGSGSSGVSSLSSQGAPASMEPPQLHQSSAINNNNNATSVNNSKDICDNPSWNYSMSPPPPEKSRYSNSKLNTSLGAIGYTSPTGRREQTTGAGEGRNGVSQLHHHSANTKRISTAKKSESFNTRGSSAAPSVVSGGQRRSINGNNVPQESTSSEPVKKSILKNSGASNSSAIPGKLPVPITTSPTSPTSSNLSSPNSIKMFPAAAANPNNSGLPSPPNNVAAEQHQPRSSFQTYRQYKEQLKLSRQSESIYRSEQKTNGSSVVAQKHSVEVRSYYDRMQSVGLPRAGAPPETSPPPPPTHHPAAAKQGPPPVGSRTTRIPTASRSPSSVSSSGSSVMSGGGGRGGGVARGQEKFTMKRESERAAVHDMHIHNLRQNIESRLKISLAKDLADCLMDGVVLCHMANHVLPRAVNSIHVPSPAVPKLSPAKCRRNVENFISACRRIGVRDDLICGSADILEPNKNNTVRVAITISELIRFKPV